jgi:hypothetical protein
VRGPVGPGRLGGSTARRLRGTAHRHFAGLLAAIVGAAALVRGLAVASFGDEPLPFSDPLWFVRQASALADGKWFVDPAAYDHCGVQVAGAQHPPMFSAYLAVPHLLGFESHAAMRWATVLLGLATVLLAGLLARHLAGPVAGLAAAALAAAYPHLWDTEALVLSEALFVALCLTVLLLAHRFLDAPSPWRAGALGAAIGAAVLTRSEALLLFALLAVPAVVRVARRDRRRLGALLGATAAGGALLLAPWAAYNLGRFEEPVLLGNGLGVTLAGASCDDVWPGGPAPGWWSGRCVPALAIGAGGHLALAEPGEPPAPLCASPRSRSDESVRDRMFRDAALRYVGDNLDGLPQVMAARAGRMWALYRPWGTTRIETIEGREHAFAALAGFLAVVPLGIAGIGVLRRRRVPILPLVSLILMAAITGVAVYGHPRFRLAADAGILVAAGVALGALVDRAAGRLPGTGVPSSGNGRPAGNRAGRRPSS